MQEPLNRTPATPARTDGREHAVTLNGADAGPAFTQTVSIDVNDVTPPSVSCPPGPNPAGKVPHANNQDGFYRMVASDNVDASVPIYVKDLGSGKVFGPYASGTTFKLTQAPGTVTGTVAYLAPEQIRGEPAGPPTDLYALGIVAYELLTGYVPFRAETSVAVAYKHLEERVPAPSSAEHGVPPDLDRLILWATEKEPDLRPAGAADLHRELGVAREVVHPATLSRGEGARQPLGAVTNATSRESQTRSYPIRT